VLRASAKTESIASRRSAGYRNDASRSFLVPRKRTPHFHIVAVIRCQKVRTDQQQDDACILQMSVNTLSKRITSRNASIIPSGNCALTPEHG
jgi:hypothetical protein